MNPNSRDRPGDSRHAADVPAAHREDRRQARGAHSRLPHAALAEAGALQREERGPLRPRRTLLHALHLAHPPLSRPHRASHRKRLLHAGAKGHGVLAPGEPHSPKTRPHHQPSEFPGNGAKRVSPDEQSPIPEGELAAIAQESSETERRAADAERELIEWKKIKFMRDRVGEDPSTA
jgi:hypothetical protein